MYVHVRYGLLHSPRHVDVVVAVEVGVNTALQGYFGGAQFPRFACAVGDVVEGEQIRCAAQVEAQLTLREAAELALERAYVGGIDVAVVYPCHGVANRVPTQFIGQRRNCVDFGPPRPKQVDDLGMSNLMPQTNTIEDLIDGRPRFGVCELGIVDRDQHGRFHVRAAVPLRTAVPDEHHFGAIEYDIASRHPLGPHRAWVVTAEPLGVATVHHRKVKVWIEPTTRFVSEFGVDGESGG